MDWDHVAAISDLTGSSSNRRRGITLAVWYSAGHASVVAVLCCLVVFVGIAVPAKLDQWMGQAVGVSLIVLGIVLLRSLLKSGTEFQLKSRWFLILDGVFAGFRRVRSIGDRRVISVTHVHDYVESDTPQRSDPNSHEHLPLSEAAENVWVEYVPEGQSVDECAAREVVFGAHEHQINLPFSATPGRRVGAAAGIGVLHGVGFESPTQVAVLASSASMQGWGSGIFLTLVWVVGLLVANAALACLACFGLLNKFGGSRPQKVLGSIAAFMSIALGCFYVF